MNKLTDFPEETLRVMLEAVQEKQKTTTGYLKRIHAMGEETERLLDQKVNECYEKIAHLQMAEIQIKTALIQVENDHKISMN